jgi:hypothetical protein
MISRESIAREMFPAEYAAIDDDHPMPPDKIKAVNAEFARKMTVSTAGEIMEIMIYSILSGDNPEESFAKIVKLLDSSVRSWKETS